MDKATRVDKAQRTRMRLVQMYRPGDFNEFFSRQAMGPANFYVGHWIAQTLPFVLQGVPSAVCPMPKTQALWDDVLARNNLRNFCVLDRGSVVGNDVLQVLELARALAEYTVVAFDVRDVADELDNIFYTALNTCFCFYFG